MTRSVTLSSLDDLPDELILEILIHIYLTTTPCRHKSSVFYSLALTNRRLHRLAIPYLYSQYHFSFVHGNSEQFLPIIKAYPDCASYIKTIYWDYNTAEFQPRRRDHVYRDLKDRSFDALSLSNAGQLNTAYLKEDVSDPLCEGDAQHLSTCLFFTPNVQHLEVSETYQWDDHVFWFRPLLEAPHAVSHLTTAILQGPMRLENVTALIVLPSMRTLDLTEVIELRREPGRRFEWEREGQGFKSYLERRGSNIEHFHLRSSCIELRDLRDLARAFRALRSFTYEHVLHALSWTDAFGALDYDTLAYLLLPHAPTLTYLRLLDEGRSPGHGVLAEFLEKIHHFAELHTLDLAFTNRWHPIFYSLPANLENLVLRPQDHVQFSKEDSVEKGETRGLLRLFLTWEIPNGEYPHLKRIEILDWHPWYGVFPCWEAQGVSRFGERDSVCVSRAAEISGDEDLGWREDVEDGWMYVQLVRL